MKRARKTDPLTTLAPHLVGMSALEAAQAIARPSAEVAAIVESLGVDRARLVVDAYEARAATHPNRKSRGVYYTPPWVVEAMLDRVGLEGDVLDPAAGAGAFVVALSRRLGLDALDRLHACDVDSEALDACALALEAAWGADARERIERWRGTNAHVADYLRATAGERPATTIIGNPPYGLADDEQLATLFPELRGEVDLYACFLLRALVLVADGGQVALLVPDTWLTNHRARALRRLLVERTGLARIVDFGKPFATAPDTRVHAVVLRREAAVCEVESLRDGQLEPMAPAPQGELASNAAHGWFLYRTTPEARACAALEKQATPLAFGFEVLYGLRTGDNARHVVGGSGAIPLIGGLDFDAFDRRVTDRHLASAPAFERVVARQRGRWKIGIQRIRTNSRVSWRRWLEAALVEPGEVGLDSLTLVAERGRPERLTDPLCALVGVLNSSLVNRWYRLSFTDVNVKPVYVERLPIPRLPAELARLVRRRLASPANATLERAIDRLVAAAYGLCEEDLEVLERGFWGAELDRRPLPSLDEALRLAGEDDEAASG